jgi:hypothetical protein
LLGYALHTGQPVLGDDGLPAVLAPELISETDYDRLQTVLPSA